MRSCVFCKSLSDLKDIDGVYGKPRKYKVALIRHSERGSTVDYNVRGIGFRLNFCPEFGRRIESVASITDTETGVTRTIGIMDAKVVVLDSGTDKKPNNNSKEK